MTCELKKDIKHKLKETPESKIDRLIEIIGLQGIEKDIAKMRCIEHRSIVSICTTLNISESTYHRNFNLILVKINNILNEDIESIDYL